MDDKAHGLWPELFDMECESDICIETPLHLLFHGVLDDVVKVLHQFMADHNLQTSFENYVNRDLSDIAELRLEWCKTKTLPKKLWLGENELGYARILMYIYAQFFLGLKMPASSTVTDETLNNIRRLTNSLHVLICKLMTPENVHWLDADLHAKIFLSCCDKFSRGYYGDSAEAFWLGKGNFMGLLNLGEQIKEYGSLRWYWEGTHERFIQPVKSVLVSLRKGAEYLKKKMRLIHRLNVLHWLREGLRNRKTARGRGGRNVRSVRNLYRYDDEDSIESRFRRGCVLSGFYNNGDVWMVVGGKNAKKIKLCTVEMKRRGKVAEECGLVFQEMVYRNGYSEDVRALKPVEKQGLIDGHCMLLPYREQGKEFAGLYAVVFDTWEVLGENGIRMVPELCPKLFPAVSA